VGEVSIALDMEKAGEQIQPTRKQPDLEKLRKAIMTSKVYSYTGLNCLRCTDKQLESSASLG